MIKSWQERVGEVPSLAEELVARETERADLRAALAATQQRMAGFDVKRCVCVFDDDANLVRECAHHKSVREELEESANGLRAHLHEVELALEGGKGSYAEQIAALKAKLAAALAEKEEA